MSVTIGKVQLILAVLTFIVLAALLARLMDATDTPAKPFDKLPVCAQEDGNTDGKPCVWIDPDGTGAYYVDGSEYRNDNTAGR